MLEGRVGWGGDVHKEDQEGIPAERKFSYGGRMYFMVPL